jgi:hypothetical protein
MASTHGRNSPKIEGLASDNSVTTGGGMSINTNRLLRSMALSNPISPARMMKAEERHLQSNMLWLSTSRYIKDKI